MFEARAILVLQVFNDHDNDDDGGKEYCVSLFLIRLEFEIQTKQHTDHLHAFCHSFI